MPIFYLSARLGPNPVSFVNSLLENDQRFFFGGGDTADANYNYNQNQVLVDAISQGYRGAFWDTLRRLQEGTGPPQ